MGCFFSSSAEGGNTQNSEQAAEMSPRSSMSAFGISTIADPGEAFAYVHCHRKLQQNPRGYRAADQSIKYILGYNSKTKFVHLTEWATYMAENIGSDVGWKLHISIHYEDIPKAWDQVIVPLILSFELKEAKITPHLDWQDMSHATGREITLYLFRHTADELTNGNRLQEFCQALEADLVTHRIKPNKRPSPCQMVQGSHYICYRNDTGEDGKYIAARHAENYNPSEKADIYQLSAINVNVPKPASLAVPRYFTRRPAAAPPPDRDDSKEKEDEPRPAIHSP